MIKLLMNVKSYMNVMLLYVIISIAMSPIIKNSNILYLVYIDRRNLK